MDTILVIDGDLAVQRALRRTFADSRFAVAEARDCRSAVQIFDTIAPRVVIMEMLLPGGCGADLCRLIRSKSSTVPIIVLSSDCDEVDKVLLLELGADDYVTKPFSPRELVLRVQAILRRGAPVAAPGPVSYGGGVLLIDTPRRQVVVRGAAADLTPTEWGILGALATVPGRVYSRFELINRVRGYEFEGYERTIDSHVKNLRRKIEQDPGHPQIVQTVLGGGYRLGLTRDD